MNGFLIAEEGPLAGLIVRMDEGDEWIIGRDPDVAYQVLEDPMVSRKAALIRKSAKGFFLENLSDVNPTTINGAPASEPTELTEGDTVQIGGTLFRFTEIDPAGEKTPPPEKEESAPNIEEEVEEAPPESTDLFSSFKFTGEDEARWMIKVISGPNSGAEFGLEPGQAAVIGKDPNTCDITLQDLSVSRQHAKISVDASGQAVTIEDLGSRNGTLANGRPITEPQNLQSQDLIALGTTTFLIIDREQTRETIYSPPPVITPPEVEESEEEPTPKNWKQLKIAKHHLILAGLFAIFLLVGVGSMLSLFQTEPIVHETKDSTADIKKALKDFPEVEFSYNDATGKLFILGHVLTEVDHQEMIYLLKTLPHVTSIEDNVTIDEIIWDNTNALLMKNPAWRGVSMTGKMPGRFILRGYVETAEEDGQLKEYMNLNFPYLDKLVNQVIVERTLEIEIQSILLQDNFTTVTMQLVGGDLVLAGRVPKKYDDEYEDALETIRKLPGIQSVKSLVIFTSEQTARINLSGKYRVTGTSKLGNALQYVVIGGKILSTGDTLDGMTITAIEPNEVLLEKDGLKYQINYNEQ